MKAVILVICLFGIAKVSSEIYRVRRLLTAMPLGFAARLSRLACWALLLVGSVAGVPALTLAAGLLLVVSLVLQRVSTNAELKKLDGVLGGTATGAKDTWELVRRIDLRTGVTVSLSRRSLDFEDFYRLSITKMGGDVVAEHGGVDRNYIFLPHSENLLQGRYLLFGEIVNAKDEGGARVPDSIRIGAVDMAQGRFLEVFLQGAGAANREYFGLDVDATGRYVLLPYVVEDPDFPCIQVYDSQEKELVDFDSEALIDCRMEQIRWGRSRETVLFRNDITGEENRVLLDWGTRRLEMKGPSEEEHEASPPVAAHREASEGGYPPSPPLSFAAAARIVVSHQGVPYELTIHHRAESPEGDDIGGWRFANRGARRRPSGSPQRAQDRAS